jgi:hypothetical protein
MTEEEFDELRARTLPRARSPDAFRSKGHNVVMRENAVGGAVRDLLKQQHTEAPLGGWAGGTANPGPREPAPPVRPPIIFPRPDWEAEAREREEQEKQERRAEKDRR